MLGKVKTVASRVAFHTWLFLDPGVWGHGLTPRTCPVCGFTGAFSPGGRHVFQVDALCGKCRCRARHRLLRLFLERGGVDWSASRVLHFAPERMVSDFLRGKAMTYVTADLFRPDVDLNLDIENIDLPGGAFDVIVCSHVLEHVDDARALPELFRILTPGGTAVLAVPINEGLDATYEDASIVDPRQRLVHFGQGDHCKIYGRDFRDRVAKAGFILDEFVLPPPDSIRHAVPLGTRLFLGRKPASA